MTEAAFDFPDVHVGSAEYAAGPTGCTVFYFPNKVQTAIDVRGGSTGIFGWDEKLQNGEAITDAICFAGGSRYGLEASSGVAAALLEKGTHTADWTNVARVRGAILYDFGYRESTLYPDMALGKQALNNAVPNVFKNGPFGAGINARVGLPKKEPAGQGMAFGQYDALKIAVFTVVNAVGVLVDAHGTVVRGNYDAVANSRASMQTMLDAGTLTLPNGNRPLAEENTTLTLVVTNQQLSAWQLRQLGRQVHTAMGRVIQPFQTVWDGDVLFTATTNKVDSPAFSDVVSLGVRASELAQKAVLSCYSQGPDVK